MTNAKLLETTKEIVKIEKKYTHLVLKKLEEIEKRKAFAELGYSSLFKYCLKELGYSERETWHRLEAMRLMRQDSLIEEKIISNELSLTNASKIRSFSRQEKLSKNETIELVMEACSKSTREVEKIVAKRRQVEVSEEIFVRLSVSTARKLKRAKEKLGDYNDEELITMLLDRILREPVRKAQGAAYPAKVGRYISKQMRSEVYNRADHCCEYNGCNERRFLQIDHVIPFAKGGINELSNLRILCSNHNQLERIKSFGVQYFG